MNTDNTQTDEQRRVLGQVVGAFFDELARLGVRDVVISPGSRSTPLAMVAHEASRRHPERMSLYVDVDERGAAFFALGLAKATGRAACVVCTSGTAVGNWYPAVLEAESSRVPLVLLSGDRPACLQGLGAPQTCDQLKAFGDHVRRFIQMPEPSLSCAHARQAAREALIAAAPGTHDAGPVHVNFPFDEPLVPDIKQDGLFAGGCAVGGEAIAPLVRAEGYLPPRDLKALAAYLRAHRVVVLAGEGTLSQAAVCDLDRRDREAQALLAFAEAFDAPLLADPLSQLRGFGHPAIICGYDRLFDGGADPGFECVVRFGRYPVSKRVAQAVAASGAAQIVVDVRETRDFNAQTTAFVAADPLDFVVAMLEAVGECEPQEPQEPQGRSFWASDIFKDCETVAVPKRSVPAVSPVVSPAVSPVATAANEDDYVSALLEEIPPGSLLFSASSMSIRRIDAAYARGMAAGLTVLCNRGLNGIDGTLSTALGAAQAFEQTVLLTGDLALLHDLNALALQNEFMCRARSGADLPAVLIVLLNNNGGAIFDRLPQASDEPYFERLFTTPQNVDFLSAARAFGVPATRVADLDDFRESCRAAWGVPGISLLEVPACTGRGPSSAKG